MDLKDYPAVPVPPTVGRDTSHQVQVAQGLSNPALRTSRAGAGNMKEKNDQPPVFWFS